MKNEIKLIDYEIIGSLLFIGTLFISVILSYNEKLRLEKKEPLFDNKTQKNILIVNKIVVLGIVIFFLYINYEHYKVALFKNEDTYNYKVQLIPSFLAILAALIILYLVLKDNNISDIIDNPEL
ncbi:MAG: hypothetical protein MR227_01355 [Firmicutes bacterium]|nr:hypothetical protein [Bacillota bacterium]